MYGVPNNAATWVTLQSPWQATMNTSLANKGLERDSHMYTESMYLEREKTRLVSQKRQRCKDNQMTNHDWAALAIFGGGQKYFIIQNRPQTSCHFCRRKDGRPTSDSQTRCPCHVLCTPCIRGTLPWVTGAARSQYRWSSFHPRSRISKKKKKKQFTVE